MQADEKQTLSEPELPADVERELGRQTLRSEKFRALLVAATGAAIIVFVSFTAVVTRAHGNMFRAWMWSLVIIGGAIVYELGTRFIFDYFLKRDRQPPILGRFANAAVETSVPTIVLAMLSSTVSPEVALEGGAPFAYFFFIILSALRLDFRLSAFTGFVAAAGYAGVTFYHLDELRAVSSHPAEMMNGAILRPLMLLLGGLVAGLVARQIRAGLVRSLRVADERRRIVQMFGEHVSPAVVNQLLSQPAGTQSEMRQVCVFVLDIRNFTTFSETAAPDEVVAYLNRLWGSIVGIVNRHHGIVNKFLGDGFLAVFGAPLSNGNNCENALNAAREVLLYVEHASASGEIPPTRVGIGLHTGPVLVGNIGSSERREYTVIGDVVNVTFRIEQLNKQLGSTLLVSEAVCQAIPDAQFSETPQLLPIRGRQEPVQIYCLS
jgi:adenylate cyclase